MKITIIFPTLPPHLDGIGDYTAFLCEELAHQGHEITLLTGTDDAKPLKNVRIQRAFTQNDSQSISGIVAPIVAEPPDWILLQYNPFSYGKRGWNPQTPAVVRQLRKKLPQTHIAVMAHETFTASFSPQSTVMAIWQSAIFFQIGKASDLMFLSVEAWAETFQKWFPQIPVRHLPVGAAMHRSILSRAEARQQAGIDSDAFVVGLFGTAHISRMFGSVADVLRRLRENDKNTILLYVGPHGSAVREAVGDAAPIMDTGALSSDMVAQRIQAMDIYMTPYSDGISTRRSAFMAGIQHGLPTVGTVGIHSDSIIKKYEGTALFAPMVSDTHALQQRALELQNDAGLRAKMGKAAQEFYDTNFDWPVIVKKMIREMEAVAEK